MKKKDLAYSFEQLVGFLLKMAEVERVGNDMFHYKNAQIILTPKGIDPLFHMSRCYMELRGNTADCDAFYKQFLLQYMTMGG